MSVWAPCPDGAPALRRSPLYGRHAVSLQVFVAEAEVVVAEETAVGRQGRWVWRPENEVALGNARHAAYTDSLTRVKNKHAFCEWEQRLDGEIAGKNAEPFAAVFCDLNGLKHVNDTYGHTAGDVYLCRACRVICKTFAHSPVFRVGGDEFAVILRGDDFLRREELMAQLDAVSVGNIGKEQEPVIAAGMEDFDAARDTALRNVFERADAKMYVRKQELKDMGARIRE